MKTYSANNLAVRVSSVPKVLWYIFLISASLVSVYFPIGGMRLNPSDLVGILFSLVVIFNLIYLGRINVDKKRLVMIPIFLYGFCLLGEVLSILNMVFLPNNGSFLQVSKLLVSSVITKLILVSFLLYQAATGFRDSQKFLLFFSIGLIASCVYQFSFLYLGIFQDINLDQLVWPKLTFGAWNYDFNSLKFGLGDEGFTFRHGGFAVNPNFLAAQLTCAIPVFFYLSYFKSAKYYLFLFLFIASMIATLSRSGLGALLIIAMLICFTLISTSVRNLSKTFIGLVLLIVLGYLIKQGFPEMPLFQIADASFSRFTFESYSDNPRMGLFLAGLDMWADSPVFGVGIGNSAFLLSNYPIVNSTGHSLHNYWLMLVVERGIFSVGYLLLFMYFLYIGTLFKNIYGQSLAVAICGLLFIGLFNTSVGSIQIQVFILLLYCSAIQNMLTKE